MAEDFKKIIDKVNRECDRKIEYENVDPPINGIWKIIILFLISAVLWAIIAGVVIGIFFGVKKVFAAETIQAYKPTYFIAGDKENQVKYQVSMKYALFYPFETGVFLAYTQLSKWDLYDQSSPFRETNYNPSIFWEMENINQWIDFIRVIPYEHKSNGRDGQESRGWDRYFGETQISYGQILNIGLREKVGGFYAISNKNHDIKRYIGYFETEVFMQLKSKHGYIGHEKIYIKGEWTHRFYWYEAGLTFRIFTAKIQPDIYIQYFRGYSEFLIDYNKKTEALRAGFIFNN